MSLLVTGAGGLLGSEVMAVAADVGHEATGLTRADLDVTDALATRLALVANAPRAVVHCAAYTAVDGAEAEPELAMYVNRDGANNVARAAAAVGAVMVYVSTDFVFDGESEKPYLPGDTPNPLGAYGRSKLEGERVVAASGAAHLVVRTSWLYGGGGSNFVTAVLDRAADGQALRVVGDQRGRPTWSRSLARTLIDLLDGGARGIWHAADRGDTTWYDLAVEALRLRRLDVPVERVATEEWGAPAPRPRFSVLDITAAEAFLDRRMTPWPQALAAYLEET